MKKLYLILAVLGAVFLVFFSGAFSGYFYSEKNQSANIASTVEPGYKDSHVVFLLGVYDKIQNNYWQRMNDVELANLFKAGVERLLGGAHVLKTKDKSGLEKMLKDSLKNLKEDKKQEFTVKLADLVLQNLEPRGRSRLYTTQKKKQLSDRVNNIDRDKNLYEDLGIGEGASEKEVEEAYKEKSAELEKQDTEEAEKELEKVKYAHEVLSDQNKKSTYDKSGAEPTVIGKMLNEDILHLKIAQFSPRTLSEFQLEAQKFDKEESLDTLILDLRNNVGGSIDILPYFLGPFIGKDQYAYELLHQSEKMPVKTKTGWLKSLVRYKEVVILINDKTQSTAELMASVLKKYNVGTVVGTKTRGWGTIEKVFELENQISEEQQYSMFLVHTLTLRDDSQPIEGNGVMPMVNINNKNWQEELNAYLHYPELVNAVGEIWKS